MSISINEQVGVTIKKCREKLRITQEEFAYRLGISRPSVTNIENGRQQLTVVQLINFANVLGIDPAELLPTHLDNRALRPVAAIIPEGTEASIRDWAEKAIRGNG